MSCRYFGFCESEGLFVVLVLGVLEVSSPASIDAPAPTEPDCEVLEPMLPLLLELVPIPLFGEELVDEPVVGELLVDEPVVGEVLVDEVLFGDVLVDEPVVAELSVEVPVVAELSVGVPVVALPLALTPVFGVVVAPERVSSPVVPGVAVPVAPVALPVPEPAVPVDVPAVVPPVPPTEPEPVPPPVCARPPAAARAPAARIVPVNLPIPISSSFPGRVATPSPSGNPAEIPRHRLVDQSRARSYCGGQRTVAPSCRAAVNGQYGSRRSWRARTTTSACPVRSTCSACSALRIIPTAPVLMPTSRRMRSANGAW